MRKMRAFFFQPQYIMSSDTNVVEKISRYQQFLKQDPNNINLTIDLVDLLCQANRWEDAQRVIDECPPLVKESVAIILKKGEVFLLQRDFTSARTYLEQHIDTNHEFSKHHMAQHMLGLCHFFQEQYSDAIPAFENSLNTMSSEPQNLKYLAYSHHHLNQLTQALRYAEEWAQATPSADSFGYLAIILFDLNKLEAAEEYARRAIELAPDQSDAQVIIGSIVLAKGQLANAIEAFQIASKSNPNSGRTWLGLGLVALAQQATNEARSFLERAQTLMPKHIGTTLALGWLKFKLGEIEQAKSEFENALALDRNFAESHGALACAYIMLDQIESATEHITLARKLDPHNFASAYAQVLQLRKQGKANEAEALQSKIMNQRPPQQSMTLVELVQSFAQPIQ